MTNKNNDLVVYQENLPAEDINTWVSIVDELYETLGRADAMPDKVVGAAEMMVAGFPLYKIAKELDVPTKTVRSWLVTYPELAKAVAIARQDMGKWRMHMLESQFLQALQKSEEVLTLSAKNVASSEEDLVKETVNAKLLGIQMQQARFIISLFVGNKFDLNVTIREDLPTLKATQNALEYIASQIRTQDEEEPIDAVVRVIDVESPGGTLLDENGNPFHGVLGKLDITDEGTLCHICGKRFQRLDIHVRVKERLSNEDYETIFMLPPGAMKDEVVEREDGQQETRDSSP